jgi:hypothetical protein
MGHVANWIMMYAGTGTKHLPAPEPLTLLQCRAGHIET